ncbi:MAG: hypothetical protein K0S46_2521 [Moraxellaceae bacterium]|jgi:hypothetical protein|nr:hypothetical protein [Moraxellaceae bacterium]
MYQDPLNQNRSVKPQEQNPDNQESLAGPWQKIIDTAQDYWKDLTDADIAHARRGRRELIETLQRRYDLSAHEADQRIEAFLSHPHRKGFFERLTEMNGKLKINQYVSNPAPGPSARDDQPPAVLPDDAEK